MNRIAVSRFPNVLRMLAVALAALVPAAAPAAEFVSVDDGNYTNETTWGALTFPNLTGADNARVLTAVDYNGGYVTGDFTVRGGSVLTIGAGGSWTQSLGGSWIRIADQDGAGSLNIEGGVFSPGTANNLMVGGFTAGALGLVNVGDGAGAAGTAVLDMAGKPLTMGRNAGTTGEVAIVSDGSVWNAGGVRLGEDSGGNGGGHGALTLAGGTLTNAAGRTYIAASATGSSGAMNVGSNGVYVHSAGDEFWVGGRGVGRLDITGNGQVILSNTNALNHHLAVFSGTGTMVVADSGVFTNASSGNFTLGGVGAGSGVGTIVVSNQGRIAMPYAPFQVGSSSAGGGQGYVYLHDDAELLVHRGWIGHNASVTGAVVMAGNSRFTVQDGGFFVVGEFGQGTLTLMGNASMQASLNSGTANFALGAQNGGTGANSGRGQAFLFDNAAVTNNGVSVLGLNGNTSGELTLRDASRWRANSQTTIGNGLSATGRLTVADSADYYAGAAVVGANGTSSVGRLVLEGGTWRQHGPAGISGGIGDFRIELGGGRLLAGANFTIDAAAPIELTGIGGAGTLDASNSVMAVQGVVSGGSLVVTGLYANSTGRVGLMAANTYTGGTTIAGGTLTITNDAALGAAPAAPQAGNLTIDGGILANMRADYSAGEDVTIAANRGITLGAGGGTFRTGYGRLLAVDGVIAGTGKLLKTDGDAGAGALVLNAANTFTNNTEWANIGVGRGIIRLGHPHALQFSTVVMPDAADATLDLNGLDNAVLGGLAGGGAAGGNVDIPAGLTLQVGTNGQSTVYAGSLSGGTLRKAGAGVLTLSGNHAHEQSVIDGGTLEVNGLHAGPVAVNSNGTLRGVGVVGEVTVLGALNSLSGSMQTLSTSNLTFLAGSSFNARLGTASDLTLVDGNLVLNGTLNIADAGGLVPGVYLLFEYTGTLSGPGLTVGSVPNPAYTYTVDTTSANQVLLVVEEGTPAPRMESVAVSGADVRVGWTGAGGQTHVVQASTNLLSGFADLGGPIVLGGAGDVSTNYLHAGAATNAPMRHYRVRVLP